VVYEDGVIEPQALIDRLGFLGYMARPFDPRETGLTKDDRENTRLLKALLRGRFCFFEIAIFGHYRLSIG
jgi:hypothetical protein